IPRLVASSKLSGEVAEISVTRAIDMLLSFLVASHGEQKADLNVPLCAKNEVSRPAKARGVDYHCELAWQRQRRQVTIMPLMETQAPRWSGISAYRACLACLDFKPRCRQFRG
ncbi:MAG: hypothetical protein WEB56_00035, partial [Roseovarius sp.]